MEVARIGGSPSQTARPPRSAAQPMQGTHPAFGRIASHVKRVIAMPGRTDRRARRRPLRSHSSRLPVPAPAGQWSCFPGGVPPRGLSQRAS